MIIKLKILLLENSTRQKYIESLKLTFPNIKASSGKNNSTFIDITLQKKDGTKQKIKRFVTNSTLNITHSSEDRELEYHDVEFAKKHNLKITGRKK